MPTEDDKIIDLPTEGPGVEVTLPEENIKEGAQEINVPETIPEGEVEIKETEKVGEKPAELITEEKSEEPKKELEEYSEGVKKRIAKLTKRMREAERQRDESTKYAKSVLTEQRSLKDRLSKVDKGFVSEMENRIVSGIEAAQAKLATARENSDLKSEVEASKEIAKLGYEEARLAEMKIKQSEKAEVRAPVVPQNFTPNQNQMPQPDAKATEWAEKNEWFGKDNAMTYTAFDVHKSLVEEEGYDPQSGDYYMELDRRIKLEFPHKFGTTTKSTIRPTQTVASATRGVTKTSRRTVQLTPSQVAIARKLNVPLEEYAKQLNIEE
jgi:uncharacterized protein YigA (DUF484 family)|tara:strand:+ start:275 stop:1246 length:972 start_codon:yes stop_codon:yes gene_type:complete